MVTARDSLLLEILTLTKRPYSKISKTHISNLLSEYRVQTKPGVVLQGETTARETLENRILFAWQTFKSSELEDRVKQAIDDYRMQFKQEGKNKNSKETELVLLKDNKLNTNARLSSARKKSEPIAIHFRKSGGPIAGGPKKRQYSRSECPKCHSMGVVLARASSGDGYFSCIYCGFQAYRGRLDSELDLPLAAELLGRRFDEEKEMED